MLCTYVFQHFLSKRPTWAFTHIGVLIYPRTFRIEVSFYVDACFIPTTTTFFNPGYGCGGRSQLLSSLLSVKV